ncbi:GNAT superfamily N-acetyltransferase [Anaerosolibacter carboniphilus]|uniref:GNAT superfamily N-acetyltransferase n=1 Tax=Anaerosolibacter carboniphilus TaxID=1417629 RepID=A0A841KRP4_9FIRM|nr:GNAT family N-acetyltransferase [Anaerosolibacter carboniphilus]MBB6216087.1 GNAT superfamily N-acetyltransferase [Anaerosolibacter carboniphilus]
MKYTIREIELHEFKDIYDRIERDFVPGEYAPYEILYQQLQEGVQTGLILLDGERAVAYGICAGEDGSDYVLISLLAAYEEFRGSGFGSVLLEALKKRYSDKKGILVEVERPEDALTNEEKAIREKRIQFYQKAGFYLIPHIDYSIWDVPMHLMALPQEISSQMMNKEIGQIIYEIYFKLMGKQFIHKMKFKSLRS